MWLSPILRMNVPRWRLKLPPYLPPSTAACQGLRELGLLELGSQATGHCWPCRERLPEPRPPMSLPNVPASAPSESWDRSFPAYLHSCPDRIPHARWPVRDRRPPPAPAYESESSPVPHPEHRCGRLPVHAAVECCCRH